VEIGVLDAAASAIQYVTCVCVWLYTCSFACPGVALDVGDDRLFIGPTGAVADFAERIVPLLFAITLFVFVYQVRDT
jgi:hypothetical protein